MKSKKVKQVPYYDIWKDSPDNTKEIELEKVKSMECIKPEALEICTHLWTMSVAFGNKCVPYYCDMKEKEIINPEGKKKCVQFEKSTRSYKATHY